MAAMHSNDQCILDSYHYFLTFEETHEKLFIIYLHVKNLQLLDVIRVYCHLNGERKNGQSDITI